MFAWFYYSPLKRKAVRSFEISVNFYRTTRCHDVEYSTLQPKNQSIFPRVYTLLQNPYPTNVTFSRSLQFFFPLPSSLLLSFPLLFAWSGWCKTKRFNGVGSSAHNVGATEKAESCHCVLSTGRDNQLLSHPRQDNNDGVARSSQLIQSLRQEGVALTTLCGPILLSLHIHLFLNLYHNGNTNISSINQLYANRYK
jgi:hypothetical protein